MWCAGGWRAAGFPAFDVPAIRPFGRSHASPIQFRTDLEIREVSIDEIEAPATSWARPCGPNMRGLGSDGFFTTWRLTAAARWPSRPLRVRGPWISDGGGDRRKSSQTRRSTGAHCEEGRAGRTDRFSLLVSETLYMIEHSYRNLQRAGFQEVYEKEVYEWSA